MIEGAAIKESLKARPIGLALTNEGQARALKNEYPTFDVFCVAEYDMVSRHANRLIEAWAVKASLVGDPMGLELTNERQSRSANDRIGEDKSRSRRRGVN